VEEKAKWVSLFTAWFFAYSSTPKMEAILSPEKFVIPAELYGVAPEDTVLVRVVSVNCSLMGSLQKSLCSDAWYTAIAVRIILKRIFLENGRDPRANTCDAKPALRTSSVALTSLITTINVSIGAVP
jgi:hypothetical protein